MMDRCAFLKLLLERSEVSQDYLKEKYRNRIYKKVPRQMQIAKLEQCKVKITEKSSKQLNQMKPLPSKHNFWSNKLTSSEKYNNFSQKHKSMAVSINSHQNNYRYYESNATQMNKYQQTMNYTQQRYLSFFKNKKKSNQKVYDFKESNQEISPINYTLSASLKSQNKKSGNLITNRNICPYKMQIKMMSFQSNKTIKNKPKSDTTKTIQSQKIKPKFKINPQLNLYPPPPRLTAKSYIISEMHQSLPPEIHLSFQSKCMVQVASLTKIMTCFAIIQFCERHQINMNEELVRIGHFQSNVGGTSANLQNGQIYTLYQLLYALMLPSGNDASLAISVFGGRLMMIADEYKKYAKKLVQTTNFNGYRNQRVLSMKKPKRFYYLRFIQQMNAKARQIGMTKTIYGNPHGLVNQTNKSCANDLALLCSHCMRNKTFSQIVRTKIFKSTIKYHDQDSECQLEKQKRHQQNQSENEVQYDELSKHFDEQSNDEINLFGQNLKQKNIEWQNTHKLLQKNEQYLGIKTGITNAAGSCLASCIVKSNKKYIIIVLGCDKISLRFSETEILKKWLFSKEKLEEEIQ